MKKVLTLRPFITRQQNFVSSVPRACTCRLFSSTNAESDLKVSQLGLIVDTALVLAKGGAAFFTGSTALTADAAHRSC